MNDFRLFRANRHLQHSHRYCENFCSQSFYRCKLDEDDDDLKTPVERATPASCRRLTVPQSPAVTVTADRLMRRQLDFVPAVAFRPWWWPRNSPPNCAVLCTGPRTKRTVLGWVPPFFGWPLYAREQRTCPAVAVKKQLQQRTLWLAANHSSSDSHLSLRTHTLSLSRGLGCAISVNYT